MLNGENPSSFDSGSQEIASSDSESQARDFLQGGMETMDKTDILAELKKFMISVGIESPLFPELYSEYQEMGEAQANTSRGSEGRVQHMMNCAEIIGELGQLEDAIDAYDDALYVAEQEGFEALANNIRQKRGILLERRSNFGG